MKALPLIRLFAGSVMVSIGSLPAYAAVCPSETGVCAGDVSVSWVMLTGVANAAGDGCNCGFAVTNTRDCSTTCAKSKPTSDGDIAYECKLATPPPCDDVTVSCPKTFSMSYPGATNFVCFNIACPAQRKIYQKTRSDFFLCDPACKTCVDAWGWGAVHTCNYGIVPAGSAEPPPVSEDAQ